ncbi:TlpA disulfide reductase family protein [Sorangium sp. So ce185]|uniref:TlpA family protein disulfide reductase n=1 Tax=Sorangium sp. So ce185 TaxID=3133287 RepID=UPI003F6040BF
MLPSGAPMPSFEGATRWLHGEPTPDALRGAPVVVQFWAVSCSLCKDNLPTLRAWKDRYGPRGVSFVSVHMPRQESDTRVDRVEAVVTESGMDEPVAIDNAHAIGDRFQTGGLWPAYFLFDGERKLRARSAGAAGLSHLERALAQLTGEEGG